MAIQTRIEIRNLIFSSGLFEVEIKNGVQIPRGIYCLRGKKLSSRLIERKNVRPFFYELERILFSYLNTTETDSKAAIEELVNDAPKDIQSLFGLSELEVKKFFPKIYSPQFKTLMRKKFAKTGAFHAGRDFIIYYRLYNPLFKAFQKYIYPDKKTKDPIYHHMSYFLVACKIEMPDSMKVYERIRKAMYRFAKDNIPREVEIIQAPLPTLWDNF